MPNTKSAKKRARQALKRRARNRAYKSAAKTAIKRFLAAIEAGDVQAAEQALRTAASRLDRAAAKGVIHKNQAARKKSRLAQKLAKLLKANSAA